MLRAYLCPAGVWSIGYGSTKFRGRNVIPSDTCTVEEAEAMLTLEVLNVTRAIKKVIQVPVQDHELAAMISLAYNIGAGAFAASTLLRLLNTGAPVTLVAEQFTRWNKSGSKVLPGLVKRRAEEKELFLNAQV